MIVVGLPKNVAFAITAFRLAMAATFLIATLVIGFGVAWILSGRLIRPLRQLGKDASLLASGELGHRSTVCSQDEVGTLADDFNRMATALERRAQEAHCAADEIRQAKDTLAAVIDASPVAIVCCDLERKTMLWNRTAEKMFGYSAAEVIGLPSRLTPTEGSAQSQTLFEQAASGETFHGVELTRTRKDGSSIQVRVAAAPMYNLDGTVRGVARAYEDITESKRAQEQLSRLAHYDPLTGLPNRLSLQKELGRLLAGCRQSPVSIALFDLDGFKDVNDTLGHSTGDQLLIEVCQRFIEVADNLARPAKVCRLGGDEFVIIVPDCGDPRMVAEIVDLILRRLKDPFDVNGNVLHLGSSAGIAIAPNDAVQADELIANADLALYQAKAEGGQTYRFFLPALRARAQARRGLGVELRRAYAENELELYYQPQIRLADNAVVGAEALLRWRHPERGLIAPAAFIDALAESSIAPEVGRWIIATACQQTAAWHAAGLMLNRIGVNLFPVQAHSQELLQDVEDALRASGLGRRHARARDHRERRPQLRGCERHAAQGPGHRGAARIRRFRHRLRLAQPSDPLPDLADQDRSQLRQPGDQQRRGCRHRALADRDGAQSRPARGRRGRGDRGAGRLPAEGELRGGARLSVCQAAAGRRVRDLSERPPPRRCRPKARSSPPRSAAASPPPPLPRRGASCAGLEITHLHGADTSISRRTPCLAPLARKSAS